MFGEALSQWGPRVDDTSGVSMMQTSHSLPGTFLGRWRGAAAFGVVQPSSAAGSILPALPGLCLPPAERNAHVRVPVFPFPQLNELVTPDGDAALVMGTFSHGACSFRHCVAKYSCAYGPSDTITVSCSAPLRFKKPKEHFGNSYIKSRYL